MEASIGVHVSPCQNEECQSTKPGRRVRGYCYRCYELWRANGLQLRECYFDASHGTILNWAPGRARQKGIVACRTCADSRRGAWSFLYDACLACGLTTTKHGAHGWCNTCHKAHSRGSRRQTSCAGCGQRTDLVKHGPQLLCKTCLRGKIVAVKNYLVTGGHRTPIYRAQQLDPDTFRDYSLALRTGNVERFARGPSSHLAPILLAEYHKLCQSRSSTQAMCRNNYLTELHRAARCGDPAAADELWQIAWRERIRRRTRRFFLNQGWGDSDDLEGCARLGFWQGILAWRPDGGMSLLNFLAHCAEARIKDLFTAATREKRRDLTKRASLSAPIRSDGVQISLLEILPGERSTEEQVIENMTDEELFPTFLGYATNGTLEHRLINSMYHNPGLVWRDYAKKLGVTEKAVDNALQRIRRHYRAQNTAS